MKTDTGATLLRRAKAPDSNYESPALTAELQAPLDRWIIMPEHTLAEKEFGAKHRVKDETERWSEAMSLGLAVTRSLEPRLKQLVFKRSATVGWTASNRFPAASRRAVCNATEGNAD